MGIINLIRRLTIEQWLAIDAEYLQPEKKIDAKGISSLVFMALMLATRRYYGRASFFRSVFGNGIMSWPFPYLWAYLYGSLSIFVFNFLIPALFIWLVFHEGIRDHGFTLKGIGRYKWLYLAMLMVVLPLVLIASRFPAFISKYPLYRGAGNSWTEFLIYESGYGLSFVALEFFFRGFMLFTMARYLGSYAIFVMVIPYMMIHFGKPFAETIGSIIAGTALGTMSLRTRSIFGGVLVHVLIAWSMDILAILAK